MLDNVAYLRQGSSDVQAQPDEIVSLATQFTYWRSAPRDLNLHPALTIAVT
jgi:hypothetical protein